MGLMPAVFWRLTMAEWRAMLAGYADRRKGDWRRKAWAVSYQLIAAGCEPHKVTPAKLLGEKEKRKPKEELSINEIFERMPRIDANGKPVKAEANGE